MPTIGPVLHLFIHNVVNRWTGNKPRPEGRRLDSPFGAKDVVLRVCFQTRFENTLLACIHQCAVKSQQTTVNKENKNTRERVAPPGTAWRVGRGNEVDQALQEKAPFRGSGSAQAVI